MPPKTSAGSKELGEAIRNRRNDLGLTIAKAAEKARISAKTWARYESGEAIRKDKLHGVLKALNWKALPETGLELDDEAGAFLESLLRSEEPSFDIGASHEAWSSYLEEGYGPCAAAMFAVGSDLALDYAEADLRELASCSRGTHLGEIFSSLDYLLPQQFLTRYDYEFVYALLVAVKYLRYRAKSGMQIVAHTVMEELALSLIIQQAEIFSESVGVDFSAIDDECPEGLFAEICGDDDLHMWLYSSLMGPLTPDHPYHFDHWLESQFYCGRG